MPNTSGCGGNSEIRPQNWPHPIPQAGSHWQTCCSPVTSGPTGLETCVDAENSLCIEDSATGDLMVSSWTGLSGVPGLGVSVPSRPGKTCLRGLKAQCGNFSLFLSPRLYVKSILEVAKVKKMPFLPI